MKNPKAFTIGADPEFCVVKNQELKNGDSFKESNCFGHDGGGVALEIRPDFSTDPLRVVANIHRNLLQVVMKDPKFLTDYEWHAGSHVKGTPIGGHIHFGGIPTTTLKVTTACNWLDQFVGATTVLIEKYDEGVARRNSGYGGKGDHRTNEHGFEYRTPSSWITSPYIAGAVLCLAKATVHEAIKQNGSGCPDFVSADQIRQMRVGPIRDNFPKIWEGITKMELYKEYQPQIDLIATLINNKRTWFPKASMKQSWGIVNFEEMPKPENENLKLESIWSEVTERKTQYI